MKKALIVATVSRQFTLFERGNIEVLKELGYEIHGAANYEDATPALEELGIKQHHIDIQRDPFKLDNFKAYRQLVKLIKEEEFDLVHCHAPMGGIIGRLAAKNVGIKNVLYTAHGFHFFKGAPFINNLIYKNIEKLMAYYTDVIITMNKEDFEAANKFKINKKIKIYYIPGVGIDTKAIEKLKDNKISKRKELGISKEAYVILSVGEFIDRKNYPTALKAFSKADIENSIFLICGRGEKEKELKALTEKLGLSKKVIFAGYRQDIKEIVHVADVFLFPSFQEGLPVSVMEAMAASKACIVSRIRGNTDLIEHNKGGYVYDPKDIEGFSSAIKKLASNMELTEKLGEYNLLMVREFDIYNVKNKMMDIYKQLS